MKIYEIVDDENNMTIGVILYYEKVREFIIELEEYLDEWTAPLLFTSFIKRGIYTIPKGISLLWVKERIIPSGRQNINDILNTHKLAQYDEMKFLEIASGKSSQDSLYIRGIDYIPEYVLVRQRGLVTEVTALDGNRLLVFFADDSVRIIELSELKYIDGIDKVIKNKVLYNSVKVGVGGYSITFNNSIDIEAYNLYSSGELLPLKSADFISFVSKNICDTEKSCQILECSRQNLSYLVKHGRLTAISENVKGNLYTKGSIERSRY